MFKPLPSLTSLVAIKEGGEDELISEKPGVAI